MKERMERKKERMERKKKERMERKKKERKEMERRMRRRRRRGITSITGRRMEGGLQRRKEDIKVSEKIHLPTFRYRGLYFF